MLYQVTSSSASSLIPSPSGHRRQAGNYYQPQQPLSDTGFGRAMAASAEIIARITANFGKPAFGLPTTLIDGPAVEVTEEILRRKPFCDLNRFHRDIARRGSQGAAGGADGGHFATLLRGTVEALLPEHDVHITDWRDARQVPLTQGSSRSRRLHRISHRLHPRPGTGRACHRRVPAFGAGDGRRLR